MAEWVSDDETEKGRCTLTIGSTRAVIREIHDDWFVFGIEDVLSLSSFSEQPSREGKETLDAAKAAAEQALREMHAALSEHFAPVLRWQQLPSGWLAEFGCWSLYARQNHWTLHHCQRPDWNRVLVESPPMSSGYRADEEQARRAAEAALRSLGVVFRTEGE